MIEICLSSAKKIRELANESQRLRSILKTAPADQTDAIREKLEETDFYLGTLARTTIHL